MSRIYLSAGVLVLWTACLAGADPARCVVKETTSPPPKELKESIRALLSDKAVLVLDETGKPVCELWFRKEVPAKASADDVQKGLRYQQLEQTTLLGAVRFDQLWSDFRKQRVKPGVYTLRLAFQPMDGNHMGTAPFNEFCLLVPAADDPKPDPMTFKQLFELSAKSTMEATHAGLMLLYPGEPATAAARLVDKGGGNYILNWKTEAAAAGQKGPLGLGLTLFGATTAE